MDTILDFHVLDTILYSASQGRLAFAKLGGMRTYSLDLRERVLAAVDRGMPRKEAVGVFGVSLATLKRWLKRRQETGSVAPRRRPGMRRRMGATSEERGALWRQTDMYAETV